MVVVLGPFSSGRRRSAEDRGTEDVGRTATTFAPGRPYVNTLFE
jgi:hypothetical protein